jgi:hypothetical protein
MAGFRQQSVDPAEAVRRHAQERIRHFIDGRDLDVYQGLRSISSQVSESYRSRLIVELVQNAHDAHPPSAKAADGRIAIVLDEGEGPHGCLYVANAGTGFALKNFSKLCGVATSSKQINEGIGYKGIGFLSVLQVSAHPEVFSMLGPAGVSVDFDGFRFRIPDDDALRVALEQFGFAAHAEAVSREMPRLLLPMPIKDTPEPCRSFARDGFATVVRLPIKNEESRIATRDQVETMSSAETPLHLFLSRIGEIKVSIRGGQKELFRCFSRVPTNMFQESGIEFCEIEVADGTRFLLATTAIGRGEFINIVREDIAAERISLEWENWEGDAVIALAVPIDGSSIEGRLYNFLPMSDDACSPFPGHLNAPFHTAIDRSRLTESVQLNEFLLDRASQLCLRGAQVLRDRSDGVAIYAVPDLVCWRRPYRKRMLDRIKTLSGDLASCQLAPVIGQNGRSIVWCALGTARIWPEEDDFLSAPRLAREARARVLSPELGESRLKRVKEFCRPEVDLEPSADEIADWVEMVAGKLHKRRRKRGGILSWDRLYRAIECLFRDTPEAISDRRLMLTASNRLVPLEHVGVRPRGRRHAKIRSSLFFPPVRGSEERLKRRLPRSVQRRVNFLNPTLGCCAGREDDAVVRRFFENHRLVRRHDTREFLRVLAGAMAEPGNISDVQGFRWSALQVVLDMLEPEEVSAWLAELHVPVPTRDGWVSADQAYFGKDWLTKEGRGRRAGEDLEELIDRAGPLSPEIAAIGETLVLPLARWKVETRDRERWRKLLVACGAVDHLRPVRAGSQRPPKAYGFYLVDALNRWAGLNERNSELWVRDIQPDGQALRNPLTNYSTDGAVWRLAGQNEYLQFPADVRDLFARQVVDLLNSLGASVTTFYVQRPDHIRMPHRTAWPTPLASFLRYEDWLPVAQVDGTTTFVKASDAWIHELDSVHRAPEFLDFATPEFLDVLNGCADAATVLKERFDLKSLRAKSSAIPLVELLGAVAAKGRVPQEALATFEKLYEGAWKNAFELTNDGADPLRPPFLAVVKSSRLVAIRTSTDVAELEPDDEDVQGVDAAVAMVWIDDASSPLPGHILAEAGRPVFPFRLNKGERIAAWLTELFPSLIKRASETDIVIHVDGSPFVPSVETPTLVDDFGPWLPEFVAIAAHLSAPFARLKLEELAVKVRQISYRRANTISVKIGDESASLPEFSDGCLFCDHADAPTIIYEARSGEHGFELLSRLSTAIDEGLGGRSQLGTAMRAGALQLARRYEDVSAPSEDDYAMIFNHPVPRVRAVLQLVRSELNRVLYWLRPVVWIMVGRGIVDHLDAIPKAVQTEASIRDALVAFEHSLALSVDDLIAACKNTISGSDLVRQLGLDMARYNEAVNALGSQYLLLDFSTEHANTFRRFVADRQRQIRESLRVHFVQAFDTGSDLSNFVAIRDATPDPDPAWGTMYLDLPEKVMEDCLSRYFAEAGVRLIGEEGWLEPSFAEVREANQVLLRNIVERAAPMVRAWCHKQSQSLPEIWSGSDVTRSLIEFVRDKGWLSFSLLAEYDFLARLQASGTWPESMPLSMSMKELLLSDEDLRTDETRARRQRDREARARRSVTVNGHEIVEDETPGHKVADLIAGHFAQNEKLRVSKFRNAQLKHASSGQGGGGFGKAGAGSDGRRRRLPEAKRQLIGFIGELIAFEWLKLHFGNDVVTEDCWVSRNRERLYPGEGDDNRGYDFAVSNKNTEWHFEVKATAGTDRFIELGVTEIADAERCRADRTTRNRILFIENALEPQEAMLHMLPNPRSAGGKNRFREVSRTGLKLAFDI